MPVDRETYLNHLEGVIIKRNTCLCQLNLIYLQRYVPNVVIHCQRGPLLSPSSLPGHLGGYGTGASSSDCSLRSLPGP